MKDQATESTYTKFLTGFEVVARDWRKKFGDREIINVNDDSNLGVFPMMGVDDFLKGRLDHE